MPALLRHPVARFVALTAVVGSLADWTLFAALVAIVDLRTEGSAWATAAVLLARLLPALAFAPLAARRIDARPLRGVLTGHEVGRVLAVVILAALAPRTPLILVALLLVGLEFAAAMLASGRESLISRHVPSDLHPAVNTATVVASYGLLPIGAVAVQLLGAGPAMLAASALYATVLLSYVVLWPATDAARSEVVLAAVPVSDAPVAPATEPVAMDLGLRRTVLAAAVGLAPIVALFTVAPRLATVWVGDATATGVPTGLLLAGGVVGLVLANLRVRAEAGLLVAGVGFAAAYVGAWQVGLVLIGLGAGLAYLALQTRLQGQADDPSQFAAAFAVLKAATVVGTLAGPTLWSLGDGPGVLLAASVVAALVATVIGSDPRPALRRVVRRAVLSVVVIEESGRRHDGPAVVISNHPNAIDGVVAMAADPTMKPIARWQKHPVARAGFWLAECVVTTAGTSQAHRSAFEAADDHLGNGGRIWLAPEGGAHTGSELRQPRTGAVRMAASAGVPVQALGIHHLGNPDGPRLGQWRPWRRPRVRLVWGDVVTVTGLVELDVERTMAALAAASGMSWTGNAPRLVRVAA